MASMCLGIESDQPTGLSLMYIITTRCFINAMSPCYESSASKRPVDEGYRSMDKICSTRSE